MTNVYIPSTAGGGSVKYFMGQVLKLNSGFIQRGKTHRWGMRHKLNVFNLTDFEKMYLYLCFVDD
jgi:hypothetical protein